MMTDLHWRRSNACGNGNCMEVAAIPNGVLVRNSATPDSAIKFTRADFAQWLAGAKAGEFDDLA